ncbi:MAG: tyrosine-type recombinase/integrase [Candidatus Marinimicrobia bacterium]|nr:tyrosine-type recombinase/integrase [Candidatus Neomarinimicrobiota bacterium]
MHLIHVHKINSSEIRDYFLYDAYTIEKTKTIQDSCLHPSGKYLSSPNSDNTLEYDSKTFEDKEICVDPTLQAATYPVIAKDKAKKQSNSFSDVKIHALRKSFATHLLYSRTDPRYVRHRHNKTTEIYTHVSTKNLSTIKNPLDNLLKKV